MPPAAGMRSRSRNRLIALLILAFPFIVLLAFLVYSLARHE